MLSRFSVRVALSLLLALALPIGLLAQAAAVAVDAGVASVEATGTDLFATLPANGLLAMVLVPIISWLRKNERVKVINDKTVFWFAGAASALAALGIHGAISPTGFEVHGSWADLGDGIFDVVKQWSALHWAHKGQQVVELLPQFIKSIGDANRLAGGTGTAGGQ